MHNHGRKLQPPLPTALGLHGSRAPPPARHFSPPNAVAGTLSLTMAPHRARHQRQRRAMCCGVCRIATARAAPFEPSSAPSLTLCTDRLLLIAASLYSVLAAGLMALSMAREHPPRRIGSASPPAYRRPPSQRARAQPRTSSPRPHLVTGRLVLASMSAAWCEPSVRSAWAAAAAAVVRLRCPRDAA